MVLPSKLKLAATGAVVAALLAFGARHWWVVYQRDALREDVALLELDLRQSEANVETLTGALALEREASARAAAERDNAQRALGQLRAGREQDPEAVEWAAQPVPAGERERLCAAVPTLQGCAL